MILSEFKDKLSTQILDYIPHDREQNCTTAHQVHQNEQFFVKTVKGNILQCLLTIAGVPGEKP